MFLLSKINRRGICYARINSIYYRNINKKSKIKNKRCNLCLGSGMIYDKELNRSQVCFACNGVGLINNYLNKF